MVSGRGCKISSGSPVVFADHHVPLDRQVRRNGDLVGVAVGVTGASGAGYSGRRTRAVRSAGAGPVLPG